MFVKDGLVSRKSGKKKSKYLPLFNRERVLNNGLRIRDKQFYYPQNFYYESAETQAGSGSKKS
jgi:hypothetical protein